MSRKYYNKKPICRTCLKHDPRIAKPNHKLSDNEWSIVKSREKNLSKSRNDIKNKASFELGFNPETHISIPNHKREDVAVIADIVMTQSEYALDNIRVVEVQ